MDVGAPNNFERLQWLYPDAGELRALLSADAVDDATIRATIVDAWQRQGEAICPHTACAVHVLQRRRAAGASGDWVAVSTAHPAKFPEVVEPLIGQAIALPPALAAMLERPSHAQALADDGEALRDLLRHG
jgi:threonine synthase